MVSKVADGPRGGVRVRGRFTVLKASFPEYLSARKDWAQDILGYYTKSLPMSPSLFEPSFLLAFLMANRSGLSCSNPDQANPAKSLIPNSRLRPALNIAMRVFWEKNHLLFRNKPAGKFRSYPVYQKRAPVKMCSLLVILCSPRVHICVEKKLAWMHVEPPHFCRSRVMLLSLSQMGVHLDRLEALCRATRDKSSLTNVMGREWKSQVAQQALDNVHHSRSKLKDVKVAVTGCDECRLNCCGAYCTFQVGSLTAILFCVRE